jgi:hypothetical protein
MSGPNVWCKTEYLPKSIEYNEKNLEGNICLRSILASGGLDNEMPIGNELVIFDCNA